MVFCISGVKEVQNTIRVQDQQRSSTATSATGTNAGKDNKDNKGKESQNLQH